MTHAYSRLVAGAPIELIDIDEWGGISARRGGEPSFTGVSGTGGIGGIGGIGDAIMAAMARDVELIVPAHLADELLADLPLDAMPWIQVR